MHAVWRRQVSFLSSSRERNARACVLNLGLACLIQIAAVIPLSFFVLVVHNWVLGPMVCYTLPMIQVREIVRISLLISQIHA